MDLERLREARKEGLMRISIDHLSDNAAFGDTAWQRCSQVANILEALAEKIEDQGFPEPGASWTLFDSNGNSVGICSTNATVNYDSHPGFD
jgi:hypothetical protein